MVISKLHFFSQDPFGQIRGKYFKRDSLIFNQPLLSLAPETLQAINIDFPEEKIFS